jgi:hypothetical protein
MRLADIRRNEELPPRSACHAVSNKKKTAVRSFDVAPTMSKADEATRRWASLVAEGWAKAAKISEGWEKVSAFTCGYVPIEVWRSPQRVHVYVAQVLSRVSPVLQLPAALRAKTCSCSGSE